jgi:hypothetical protein
MRVSFVFALALALFGAASALAAPDRAEALAGVGRPAVAEAGLRESVASRGRHAARRHAYRRPYHAYRRPYASPRRGYYAPSFCARPHQYYYWQWWPPVCYPL